GRTVQQFHRPTEIAFPTVRREADGTVGGHVLTDKRVARHGGNGYEIVWDRRCSCLPEWADGIRGRALERLRVDDYGNRTVGGGHLPDTGDSKDNDHDCEPTPEHEHPVSVLPCGSHRWPGVVHRQPCPSGEP